MIANLAPPLCNKGMSARDTAGIKQWLATWKGPIGWETRDLHIEIGGDVAFAFGLNRMTGTKRDGETAIFGRAARIASAGKRASGKSFTTTTRFLSTWMEASAPQPISSRKQLLERTMSANDNNSEEFVYSRTFDAPRSLVWKVYTEAEHLAQWWGPKGFTWLSGTLDFKPGGVFHYGMRSPTGDEMWGKFNYREISKPDRIIFTNSFSDKDGNTVRAPFAADWPLEILNTVTFVEEGGKTTVTLRGGPFNANAAEKARF